MKRLALHRPELRAWALYDWANSAMITVIVTAVFPIYYASASDSVVTRAKRCVASDFSKCLAATLA